MLKDKEQCNMLYLVLNGCHWQEFSEGADDGWQGQGALGDEGGCKLALKDRKVLDK